MSGATTGRLVGVATRPGTRLLRYDRGRGTRFVAGADEAGRGALAGPIVAAAVLLEPGALTLAERRLLADLDDSKRVAPTRRPVLAAGIARVCVATAVVVLPAAEIDRIGIQAANLGALARALGALPDVDDATVLVDGYRLDDLPRAHERLVRGDGTSAAVAAASVLAKTTRDRLMAGLDACHPGYGFAVHAGYGTAAHRASLDALGPSPVHRRTFRVRARAA